MPGVKLMSSLVCIVGLTPSYWFLPSKHDAIPSSRWDTNYSVETGCCCPCKAACSVCQASVAHFTRTGKLRNPGKDSQLAKLVRAAVSAAP